MKKNEFFVGMLALVLVFGMVLLGCPTDTAEEKDTWSNVTSLSQLDGTWKGSYSETRTVKEVMEEIGETWTTEMQIMFGDMKVTGDAEITSTINASAKTQSTSTQATLTFFGGNINLVWPELKKFMQNDGVTFNDTNHSATMAQSSEAQPLTDDDITELLESGFQINQNGTKIKMPAGSMGEGSPEIIMNKQ
jgi:hypothetical protein